MKVNRIWLIAGMLFIASAYYEARLKPQSRPIYERALVLYRQEDFAQSLAELERAYELEPNLTAILVLMGWNQLKLNQLDAAQENFSRAARLDPALVEARLGLAYLGLESGEGQVRLEEVRGLLAQEPRNRDYQLVAAALLRQVGQNREAAAMFRNMLGRDRYGELARRNLEQMYGLENLNEEIPADLPPLDRSNELQVNFRAQGKYLQRRRRSAWENMYVQGINIGPARPAGFASDPPTLVADYLAWLEQIAALGANTVRLYTILPPAFYRALRMHNEKPGGQPLFLIQEIWLADSPETNLFQPSIEAVSRQEIARALDVLHGQGDLPIRRGHASGLYAVDVSDYVLGILIGRELEPHLVQANNQANAERTSYSGRYVSLPEGNPTEVWLAALLDYAAFHETTKYNEQHPLSAVNWPPLDPLNHPTEAGLVEEIGFRRRLGEQLGAPPPVIDDNDAVSVDETKWQAEPDFAAGLFASYHVYPFYPDFLLHDPALLRARDSVGPNSYVGYLRDLKAHYSDMPLLIAEYGIPTSIGVSHFQPYGWNHGGLNEQEQGAALARMTQNIFDAGSAGGIVFEWQDEWFKTNWLTVPFERPLDRRAQWLNILNPEENFGLWTYEFSQSRLFSPSPAAWQEVAPLYQKSVSAPAQVLSDGGDPQRNLRSLSVSSDEAFLYIRLEVESLPQARNGTPQLDKVNYVIGISTHPGHYGSRILPGFVPQLRYADGLNFWLHVGGSNATRLLVASNYNPYGLLPITGTAARVGLEIRSPWQPVLEDFSPFEEIVVETNRARFGRDGTLFPSRRYSRSLLRYGPLDPAQPGYDSLATWSADFQSNSLIFRVPWALLFVTDPSSRQVYAATLSAADIQTARTEGIALVALSFAPPASDLDWSRFPSRPMAISDSLPTFGSQGFLTEVRKYSWQGWDSVNVPGRLKSSAAALRRIFLSLKEKRL